MLSFGVVILPLNYLITDNADAQLVVRAIGSEFGEPRLRSVLPSHSPSLSACPYPATFTILSAAIALPSTAVMLTLRVCAVLLPLQA